MVIEGDLFVLGGFKKSDCLGDKRPPRLSLKLLLCLVMLLWRLTIVHDGYESGQGPILCH